MATSFSPMRTSHGDVEMRLADVVDAVTSGPLPFRFAAYDGSATGPADAPIGLHLRSARGASYVEHTGWQAIDSLERAAGEPLGRPRVKLRSWDELLHAGRKT